MSDVTTVQIKKETLEKLKEEKEYPRQTYNNLIQKMIEAYEKIKEEKQLDKFLLKAQQPKMKELWDNKEDEAWENA